MTGGQDLIPPLFVLFAQVLFCWRDIFVCSSLAQIDLGRVRSVSGVATQGYTMQNFVKAYKLNYSTDGTTWQSYREKPNSGIKVQRYLLLFILICLGTAFVLWDIKESRPSEESISSTGNGTRAESYNHRAKLLTQIRYIFCSWPRHPHPKKSCVVE